MTLHRKSCSKGMTSIAAIIITFLIASTIAVVTTVFIVALLHPSVAIKARESTNRLLEATMVAAHAELKNERNWGQDTSTQLIEHNYLPNGEDNPDQSGVVTFNTSKPLHSVNNLGSSTRASSQVGDQIFPVEPNQVLLVAHTDSWGRSKVKFHLYEGAPFPFSLASANKLEVAGNSLIGGVEEYAQGAAIAETPNLEDLEESGIVSNSTETDSVSLKSGVKVVGDVKSLGGVLQEPNVDIIKGAIKRLQERTELPQIDPQGFDPAGDPNITSDDSEFLIRLPGGVDNEAVDEKVDSYLRYDSDITFTNGLHLDNGVLFVEGNLILDGPLKGNGAVIATGDIILKGGAQLRASDLTAIVAGGNITINGRLPSNERSSINGLVYSQTGDIQIKDTRLFGTAIAASGTGTAGSVSLEDATVVTNDEAVYRFVVSDSGASQGGGSLIGGDSETNLSTDYEIFEPNLANFFNKDGEVISPHSAQTAADQMRIIIDGEVFSDPKKAKAKLVELGKSGAASQVAEKFSVKEQEFKTRFDALKAQLASGDSQIIELNLNEYLSEPAALKLKRAGWVQLR